MTKNRQRLLAFCLLALVVVSAYAAVYNGQTLSSDLILKNNVSLSLSFKSLRHTRKEAIEIESGSSLIISGTMESGSIGLTVTQNTKKSSLRAWPNEFSYLYAEMYLNEFEEGPARLLVEPEHAQNGDLKLQVVSPLPGYDDAMLFANFQVYSKQGSGFDIYDAQQNFLTKAYATATSTGQDLLYVAKNAEAPQLLCAIDAEGNEIWPSILTDVYAYMLAPYLFDYVRIGDRIGVLDHSGKLIVPFGDIDIRRSKVLPDGNLQIEVGTFGMAGEPLDSVPYPCLDEPGSYIFAPDGTLLSFK